MINRTKFLAPAVVLLVALSASVPVLAASEWIFYGYAKYAPAPDQVGAVMDVYGLAAPGSIAPPIAVDYANYEYTAWVSGMTIATYSNSLSWRKSSTFNGGILRIYADAKAGGTAADFLNPSTFTDGSLILVASVDNGFSSILTDGPTIRDGIFVGSGSGTCDFNDGSRLGDLVAAEYYLTNWFFGGTPISDPNPTVPAGFHRVFDLKLVSPNDPTSIEPNTWGGIKRLYE